MTFDELMEFNGQPVTEEQLEELRECELVFDVEDVGLSPMYPELHWYILTLTNKQEINVFA